MGSRKSSLFALGSSPSASCIGGVGVGCAPRRVEERTGAMGLDPGTELSGWWLESDSVPHPSGVQMTKQSGASGYRPAKFYN